MLFNSLEFVLFFPIVTLIYFMLPHKVRWLHLLLASCLFYMAYVPALILVLFSIIFIDFFAAIQIENSEGQRRKWFLALSIAANLGVLTFFKYCNFFGENVNGLLHMAGIGWHFPLLHLLLPLGLSFHTFQAISYTIEVYWGNQKAERHLGIYALYVMFYPQLVAGPIERPQNMLHQFHERKQFNYADVVGGLYLVAWGLFKKIVIADRLALVTDAIFNKAVPQSGTRVVIAASLFAVQLFCDFSGYSDIARGAARVMGFELMLNFDRPFTATSVSEFWRRWHISLSSWFNEYVFNPFVLAFRRWKQASIAIGFLLTFLVCGFWHGAAWKYLVFGFFHGAAVTVEYFTARPRKKLLKSLPKWLAGTIGRVCTFAFFAFTCIYFRAKDLVQANTFVRILPHTPAELFNALRQHNLTGLRLPSIQLLSVALTLVLMLSVLQGLLFQAGFRHFFARLPAPVRWLVYYAALLAIAFCGVGAEKQFIYFQF